MMTDIYADMANKSKENVRHEKFQHLRRPFDNFFQIFGLFLILSFPTKREKKPLGFKKSQKQRNY